MKLKELVAIYYASHQFTSLKPNSKKAYVNYISILTDKIGEFDFQKSYIQPTTEPNFRTTDLQDPKGLMTAMGMKSENPMPMPVAVAMRSDVAFWRSAIESCWPTTSCRNQARLMVLRLYSFGQEHRVTESAWLEGFKPWRRVQGNKAAAFTRAEIEKILEVDDDKFDPIYKYLIAFSFFTGLRPKEAVGLKWVNYSDNLISIIGSKRTADGVLDRKVWVCEEAFDILIKIKDLKRSRDGLIFVNQLNRDVKPITYRIMAARVMQAAGVDVRRAYETRHGFATEMVACGYSVEAVAATLGNSPYVVRNHYFKPTIDQKAEMFRGFKKVEKSIDKVI